MNNKKISQPPINIFDVACYILDQDMVKQQQIEITRFKLSKMIFYIYADYLVKYKKPLFPEQPQVCFQGFIFTKLIRSLKRNYRQKKWYDITSLKTGNPLTSEQITIIHQILNKYGPLKPYELTEKMQSETPWKKTFNIDKFNVYPIMSDKLIASYYRQHDI